MIADAAWCANDKIILRIPWIKDMFKGHSNRNQNCISNHLSALMTALLKSDIMTRCLKRKNLVTLLVTDNRMMQMVQIV